MKGKYLLLPLAFLWTFPLFAQSGNVGIGIAMPQRFLHLKNNEPTMLLSGTISNGTNSGAIEFAEADNPGLPDFRIAYDGLDNRLLFQSGTGLSTRLAINRDNGTIGIGGVTNVPDGYMLAVDGKIISEEIRVENSMDWPDYVFRHDYPLMSLEQLETAIGRKGHLPGVPSAKEIEENGQPVGEIQIKLLEKLEELTLHVIRLNNEKKEMRRDLDQLKAYIYEHIPED